MRRKNFTAALIALPTAILAAATLVPAVYAAGQESPDSWLDRLLHRRRTVEQSPVIPWSHASSRPELNGGPGEGVYVWHDRNTVHVWVSGAGRDRSFRGWIEIKDGKLDSLGDEHTERDDEFRQVTEKRILFNLTAGPRPHGFHFNIKDGSFLVVEGEEDGRRAERVYMGESMADSRGNPVVFNLKN